MTSSRAALVASMEQQEPILRALALRLCGSSADAGDLVQDTFERALTRLDRFAPGTDPRAWLAKILHNLFIDRCRRQRRHPTVSLVGHDMVGPSPEPRPRWAGLTRAQLDRAVARLEPCFREPYLLHTRDGLSYKEIAQRLGLGTTTVGTRLHRARLKLRAMLDQELGVVPVRCGRWPRSAPTAHGGR